MPVRDPEIELALHQARRGIGWVRRSVPVHYGRRPGGIADRAWQLARRNGWDKRKPGQWDRR